MSTVPATISRLLMIANGECDRATLFRCHAEAPDQIICVDGGLRHCLDASLVPDVLLGDFDSAPNELLAQLDPLRTRFVNFPSEKDASDLELAMQYANTEFVTRESEQTEFPNAEAANTILTATATGSVEVMLAGLSGGRTDHMLANWMLLANPEWQFKISVYDTQGAAYLVTSATTRNIALPPGATFSLLPLTNVRGVTIEGAKYPLSNATLYPYHSRGISNVADGSVLGVSVKDGFVLLYVNIEQDNALE